MWYSRDHQLKGYSSIQFIFSFPEGFKLVLNLFGVLWVKQGSSSFSSLLQAIFRRFLLQLAVTNLSKGP